MKLEAAAFWVETTSDKPVYHMAIVEERVLEAKIAGGVIPIKKQFPFATAILTVDDFLLFHEDGRALRSALTAISKLDEVKAGDTFSYNGGA